MRICGAEGCGRPHAAKGYCSLHYGRLRRTGDAREHLAAFERGEPKPCSVRGCDEPTRRGALCNAHYQRWLRHGDPTAGQRRRRKRGTPPLPCSVEGCDTPILSRGWCANHYARWKRWGDPLGSAQRVNQQVCDADGCERGALSKGYCAKHYRRWQKHGDPLHVYTPPCRVGQWRMDSNGYIIRRWSEHPNANKNGIVAQHTAVMAEYIGRPLRRSEFVHHKNGVRHDNRLENLELWAKAHPSGQRVSELIAWAHELLETYRDDPQLWPEGLAP